MKILPRRYFRIKDLDLIIMVEYTTRKEALKDIDYMIEGMAAGEDWSDFVYYILYRDGSTDRIDEYYDGHKIRRTGIESIVLNNPMSAVVFGNFSMTEYGSTSPSFREEICLDNICELHDYEQKAR